jgi:hypothetical protein
VARPQGDATVLDHGGAVVAEAKLRAAERDLLGHGPKVRLTLL